MDDDRVQDFMSDDAIVAAVRRRAAEAGAPIRGMRWNLAPPRPVRVDLHGADEQLAAELHAEYGDRVDLYVAGFRYPFDHAASQRDPIPAPTTTRSDLAAVDLLVVPDGPTASGALFGGAVTISNRHPSESLDFVTAEWATAFLVRDGVVANDDYWPARDVGRSVMLASGEQTVLQYLGTTDARLLAPGPMVPPGDYDPVVAIDVIGSDAGGIDRLVSPPVPFRVVTSR